MPRLDVLVVSCYDTVYRIPAASRALYTGTAMVDLAIVAARNDETQNIKTYQGFGFEMQCLLIITFTFNEIHVCLPVRRIDRRERQRTSPLQCSDVERSMHLLKGLHSGLTAKTEEKIQCAALSCFAKKSETLSTSLHAS
jgi:hypothetical protein